MSEWMEEQDPVHGAYRVTLRMDRVLYQNRGGTQNVVIFENKAFGRVLALDGVVQVSERDEFVYHEMLVHVPLLAHGQVRRVLMIGGGDGGALRQIVKYPDIEQITQVEIDSAVVELSQQYLGTICGEAFKDPRLSLVYGDGVEFVAKSRESYDVILVDSVDPFGGGEVLFSEGFYRNCAARLSPGGVLVTQVVPPFVQRDWLGVPLRRMQKLFADVRCYLVPLPSFYGGPVAFGWASTNRELRQVGRETLAARQVAAGIETLYYTPDIHHGAFSLPPFVARMLPRRGAG